MKEEDAEKGGDKKEMWARENGKQRNEEKYQNNKRNKRKKKRKMHVEKIGEMCTYLTVHCVCFSIKVAFSAKMNKTDNLMQIFTKTHPCTNIYLLSFFCSFFLTSFFLHFFYYFQLPYNILLIYWLSLIFSLFLHSFLPFFFLFFFAFYFSL